MTAEAAFYNKLLATSAVTDIVQDRIFAGIVPEGADDPFLFFKQGAVRPIHVSGSDSDYLHKEYEFSAYSRDYNTAKSLAAAVQGALQDFSGTMGGVGGVTVDRIFFENELDLSESGICHIWQNYEIWYRE